MNITRTRSALAALRAIEAQDQDALNAALEAVEQSPEDLGSQSLLPTLAQLIGDDCNSLFDDNAVDDDLVNELQDQADLLFEPDADISLIAAQVDVITSRLDELSAPEAEEAEDESEAEEAEDESEAEEAEDEQRPHIELPTPEPPADELDQADLEEVEDEESDTDAAEAVEDEDSANVPLETLEADGAESDLPVAEVELTGEDANLLADAEADEDDSEDEQPDPFPGTAEAAAELAEVEDEEPELSPDNDTDEAEEAEDEDEDEVDAEDTEDEDASEDASETLSLNGEDAINRIIAGLQDDSLPRLAAADYLHELAQPLMVANADVYNALSTAEGLARDTTELVEDVVDTLRDLAGDYSFVLSRLTIELPADLASKTPTEDAVPATYEEEELPPAAAQDDSDANEDEGTEDPDEQVDHADPDPEIAESLAEIQDADWRQDDEPEVAVDDDSEDEPEAEEATDEPEEIPEDDSEDEPEAEEATDEPEEIPEDEDPFVDDEDAEVVVRAAARPAPLTEDEEVITQTGTPGAPRRHELPPRPQGIRLPQAQPEPEEDEPEAEEAEAPAPAPRPALPPRPAGIPLGAAVASPPTVAGAAAAVGASAAVGAQPAVSAGEPESEIPLAQQGSAKVCPTCDQTYNESVDFCFSDGTPLVDNTEVLDEEHTRFWNRDDMIAAAAAEEDDEPDSEPSSEAGAPSPPPVAPPSFSMPRASAQQAPTVGDEAEDTIPGDQPAPNEPVEEPDEDDIVVALPWWRRTLNALPFVGGRASAEAELDDEVEETQDSDEADAPPPLWRRAASGIARAATWLIALGGAGLLIALLLAIIAGGLGAVGYGIKSAMESSPSEPVAEAPAPAPAPAPIVSTPAPVTPAPSGNGAWSSAVETDGRVYVTVGYTEWILYDSQLRGRRVVHAGGKVQPECLSGAQGVHNATDSCPKRERLY